MQEQSKRRPEAGREVSRRDFLRSAATAAGTGALLASAPSVIANAGGHDLNVAILGAGKQGRELLKAALMPPAIPRVRFRAVCDIWEKYSQRFAAGLIRNAKQDMPNLYTDYQDLFAKEKDLDAVIVATPDWMHAEHAVAAMQAGCHVYCEKEMSQGLPGAAQIVKAARATRRICQIGHQRRSNPVYVRALELLENEGICGRITSCQGQWNRAVQKAEEMSDRYAAPPEVLKKYGYDTMHRFLNWRWYKTFSAGPIADLGSHQIDIFSWFLRAEPRSVMAMGTRYHADRDWYSDVTALYKYMSRQGAKESQVLATYHVRNTSGFDRYYERFLGEKGTLTISEDLGRCYYMPEADVRERLAETWPWMAQAVTAFDGAFETAVKTGDANQVRKHLPYVRNSSAAVPLMEALSRKNAAVAEEMKLCTMKAIHQWHLENFFDAVRAGDAGKLTCSAEVAYPTAVAVLNVNPAIETGGVRVLKKEDYEV